MLTLYPSLFLFSDLDEMHAGTMSTKRDSFLFLAFAIGAKLCSLSSKRLHCFKQYQDLVSHNVRVRLRTTCIRDTVIKHFDELEIGLYGGRGMARVFYPLVSNSAPTT